RLEAQWVVSAATDLTRIEIYTNYDRPLDKTQLACVREGIKRRLAGEPLQYISGKAAFRRLEFKVRPPVLIPRPETEVLVDGVLEEVKALDRSIGAQDVEPERTEPVRILDIGTGSGCIALSLLHEAHNVKLTATDLNPEAVALAEENAGMLGLDDPQRLSIVQDDLASSLVENPAFHGSFDIIVSNPPYIPTRELQELPEEVARYESPLALDGGEDGLVVFRRIVAQAKLLLKPGALLTCELHEDTLIAAKAHSEAEGLVDCLIHNDLTNRPRIITARMPA
ncbi:MAG TPA: peptide chain release factor N(5)-glutamine methyltransferase, partial [Coriobacteriia bacterium]|nr:peptide chain release factor N(5)-glutamine methyltransferase [Coriobacteriia bacterium]